MKRAEWVPVFLWELRRLVARTDFVITVLVTPLVLSGVILSIGWFKQREARQVTKVAVVWEAGARDPALPPRPGFEWVTPEERGDALIEAVRKRKYAGAVLLPAGFPDSAGRAIVPRESPPWLDRLKSHLDSLARVERAAARGMPAQELARLDARVAIEQRLTDPEKKRSRADRLLGVMMVVLLVMSIFTVNIYMGIGISGEKQSRVTEVVVSAIRPQSWMDGKILAYSTLGILQAVIWFAAGGFAILAFARMAPPAFHPGLALLAALFAILGFFFYASLFGMVLATVKDLQSTQKLQAYFVFLPVLPVLFVDTVLENPDGMLVTVLSLLPTFSPMLMPIRLVLGEVPAWQTFAALVVLAVATHFMRLAAGHAFRIGMLLYGKEVTLPELIRWSREA